MGRGGGGGEKNTQFFRGLLFYTHELPHTLYEASCKKRVKRFFFFLIYEIKHENVYKYNS